MSRVSRAVVYMSVRLAMPPALGYAPEKMKKMVEFDNGRSMCALFFYQLIIFFGGGKPLLLIHNIKE